MMRLDDDSIHVDRNAILRGEKEKKVFVRQNSTMIVIKGSTHNGGSAYYCVFIKNSASVSINNLPFVKIFT